MKQNYTCNSKAAKTELMISDCKLMHLREQGILRAIKEGSAFLYHKKDVEDYKEIKK